jgi:hypothetical protein
MTDDCAASVSQAMTDAGHELYFSSSELERLPHRLIQCLFQTGVDQPLSVIKALGDNDDFRTPDVVRPHIVIEIGTSTRGEVFAYKEKMDGPASYKKSCHARGAELAVIGVSFGGILTNLQLSEAEVQSIITAYAIGKSIQRAASAEGFKPHAEDRNSRSCITNDVNSIDIDSVPKSSLWLSRDDWQSFQSRTEIDYTIYSDLLRVGKEKLKVSTKQPSTATLRAVESSAADYMKRVNSLETRASMKHLPSFLAICEEGDFDSYCACVDSSTALGELWSELLSGSKKPDFSSFEISELMDYSPEEELGLRSTFHGKELLALKNRVRVNLSDSAAASLAEKGLFHKAVHKREVERGTYEKDYRGYSVMNGMDNSDVDCFVSSWESMMSQTREPCRFHRRVDMVMQSEKMKIPSDSWGLIQAFSTTSLGHALSFFSAVMSEINSNIRKPTAKQSFYLNPVPGYKALLAIHNTGTMKHSFFTLLVKSSDITIPAWSKAFRPWYDIGGFMALDLSSTRRHDLSMLLGMYSKALSIIATTRDIFSCDLSLRPSRCDSEVLFSILVCLENSNQTSETLQQVRFMYMKTQVSKLVCSNPLSPLSKFPTIIRSRVLLFATEKLISTFLATAIEVTDPQTDCEEELENDPDLPQISMDSVSGIRSFISGEKLRNYEEALFLSYLGIYHNKEKSEEFSANLQIFDKLLKAEIKLRDNDLSVLKRGREDNDPTKYLAHEFSRDHMVNCGLKILEHIDSKGVTEDILMERIVANLDSITYEELATMKASASSEGLDQVGLSSEGFKDSIIDTENPKQWQRRSKALEEVELLLRRLDVRETRPSREIGTLFRLCLDNGGIIATLFKKSQIGGTREIFILTMLSRILIKFVESIARTIAELCSNEYLTKGREKASSTPSHYSKVMSNKTSEDWLLSMCDSMDCTTWCQNFTFAAFSSVFSVLLRSWPEGGELVRGVFNMASHKRHLMPRKLAMAFIEKPEIKSFRESMNELKSQFLGTGGDLINAKSLFIKNVSNMMQGIFHYVTTVCHAGHLMVLEDVFRSIMQRSGAKSFVITTKCSSDDVSMMNSAVLRSGSLPEVAKNIKVRQLLCSVMLTESYPLMCAKISEEKSTPSVEGDFEEFNSSWTVRNTVLSVPSKFSFAAMLYGVSTSGMERQNEDHNLISDYMANGGSLNVAKVLEYCCALNHYDCLGVFSLSDLFWGQLAKKLNEADHPALWKYIISDRYLGCSFGFSVTLQRKLRDSKPAQITHGKVKKNYVGEMTERSGEINYQFRLGNNKKYSLFLERMLSGESVEAVTKRVSDDPSMLYRASASKSEIQTKLKLKALSPGVSKSFCFLDSSIMHASASYLATTPCISLAVKCDEDWVKRKMSLPALLRSVLDMESEDYQAELTSYEEELLATSDRYTGELVMIGRRRKLPVKITVPKSSNVSETSVLSIMSNIWWGIPNGISRSENLTLFDEVQDSYPLLRISYDDTVSKFKSAGFCEITDNQIRIYLERQVYKERAISFLAPVRRSGSAMAMIMSCVETMQKRGMRMIRRSEHIERGIIEHLRAAEANVYDYVMVPQALHSGQSLDLIVQSLVDLELPPINQRTIPRQLHPLYCMKECLSGSSMKSKIDSILTYGPGFVSVYEQAQVRDGREWKGPGRILVYTRGLRLRITMNDSQVIRLQSSSPESTSHHTRILTRIFRALQVRSIKSSSSTGKGPMVGLSKRRSVLYSTKSGLVVERLHLTAEPLEIELEISGLAFKFLELKIKCKIRGNSRFMTCESVKFRPTTANQRNSVHPQLLNDFIMSAQDEDSVSFIRESLRSRIDRLGLAVPRLLGDIHLGETTEAFDLDEMFDALNMSDDDLDIGDILDNIESDDEPDNLDIEFEDGWLESVAIVSYNNPYMDYSDMTLWDAWLNWISKWYKVRHLCEGTYRDIVAINSQDRLMQEVKDRLVQWSVFSMPVSEEEDPMSLVPAASGAKVVMKFSGDWADMDEDMDFNLTPDW